MARLKPHSVWKSKLDDNGNLTSTWRGMTINYGYRATKQGILERVSIRVTKVCRTHNQVEIQPLDGAHRQKQIESFRKRQFACCYLARTQPVMDDEYKEYIEKELSR